MSSLLLSILHLQYAGFQTILVRASKIEDPNCIFRERELKASRRIVMSSRWAYNLEEQFGRDRGLAAN
jgi:hypothetical protein